jgi:hypothetical protein
MLTKKFWIFFGIGVALLGAALYHFDRRHYQHNDGFQLTNIYREHPNAACWETRQLSPERMEQLQTILRQPFHYLAKGGQAYAFLSQDGQYVLKFFKYQHYRPKPWARWFSFVPAVRAQSQARKERKERWVLSAYSGWKLAVDQYPDQTQVLYVHLNKTEGLLPSCTIIDKAGEQHSVDLNRVEFLVQRRATMLEPALLEMIQAGKFLEAQELLSRLVALYRADYAQAVSDRDPCLLRNTGVVDGQPIHVDVGKLRPRKPVHDSQCASDKLRCKMLELRNWLEEKCPQLAVHLERQLSPTN